MSLLGKILAFLNLLGAAGLIYFASADYAKRQSWAYSYIRFQAALDGLPLQEQELDSNSQPLVERFSPDDINALFQSVGGNPVRTQMQEVDRLKGLLDNKVQAVAQNKPQQIYLLARILLPFADAYVERVELLSCRAHFANDALVQALKARCRKAFQEALRPGSPGLPPRPFGESFRVAFRSESGEPAESFVSLLLRQFPDDLARAATGNLDQAFDAAVESQRAALETRYRALLAEVSGQSADPSQTQKKPGQDSQKTVIARFLLGVSRFLAEEEIFTDSSKDSERKLLESAGSFAAYQDRLIATETFKRLINRALIVSGMRQALRAVNDRTEVLRKLNDYVEGAIAQDKMQFVNDHAFVISLIRDQAGLVQGEQKLITENRERLVTHETVVKERQAEIAKMQDEYNKSRAETAEEIRKLRLLSEEVLQLRLKTRQALQATEQGEQRIRDLEKQIRDLDRRQGD